jgi:hypothetical protein
METTGARKSRSILLLAAGAVAALGVVLCVELVRLKPAYIGYMEPVAKAGRHELQPSPVDPSWIVSGSPTFRANVFERLPHMSTISGLWECTGPAKFVWHYGVDEAIYILEGSAEVEYLGKKFTLKAGDSTTFISGTQATWVVSDRVKKTYRIENPGRLVRMMRRLFD